MAFSLHDFLMNGFRSAVGRMPDYKIYANSVGWFEKGILTETDLAEIQALIDVKNAPQPEPEIIEEPLPEEEEPSSPAEEEAV